MSNKSWSLEEVQDSPGFGEKRIASYRCSNCQTIIPVHFGCGQDIPPEELSTYICGGRWDGCSSTQSMKLISDGYLDS